MKECGVHPIYGNETLNFGEQKVGLDSELATCSKRSGEISEPQSWDTEIGVESSEVNDDEQNRLFRMKKLKGMKQGERN